jgi:ketosteroid isomerase-like protein
MAPDEFAYVRSALRGRAASGRALDERLAIRFPWLSATIARRMGKLPLGSRVRRALLRRVVELAMEAYNRRDLHAVELAFHPELRYYPYREFVEAGLAEPCYHGPSGYRAYIEATYDVWGKDVRLEPTALVDLGDRIVLLADMPMRAQASGIALDQSYAAVCTLKEGRVIRQQDYLDQTEALESVGLGMLTR